MSKIYTALEKIYGKRLYDGTINADIIPASIRANAVEYAGILAGKEPGDSAPILENENLPDIETPVAGDDEIEIVSEENGAAGDDGQEAVPEDDGGNDGLEENDADLGENENIGPGDDELEAVPEDDEHLGSEPNTVEDQPGDDSSVEGQPEPMRNRNFC